MAQQNSSQLKGVLERVRTERKKQKQQQRL